MTLSGKDTAFLRELKIESSTDRQTNTHTHTHTQTSYFDVSLLTEKKEAEGKKKKSDMRVGHVCVCPYKIFTITA
ncbi:hypothetical protein CRG98_036771 [Punica granatum]|uniref:Uncharacterized protein n=1 Tax=Punica granatum TaxID=22663 RepID=A0A2I0IGR5_PUNGR|nr:hypothetical protein CRG98_036771 [Punica granatum]